MPFIPNAADASTSGAASQADIDSLDFEMLADAISGDGVISGCAVTAQGTPNMTLAVSAGTAQINGATVVVAAGNVTVTSNASGSPRFDLVVVNSSGVKSVQAGAPGANPVFPSIPADSVTLAAILVPTGATLIANGGIVDKRIMVTPTRSYDLRDTGAVPGTDVTSALNGLISTVPLGSKISIPDGTWLINGGTSHTTGGIQLNRRVHLELTPGATLKVSPTSAGTYVCVYVTAADASLTGGRIEGDGTAHTGDTGEHGHGVYVATGADRFRLRSTTITLFWGDGIYVNGVNLVDISVRDVIAMDNRRNNASVIRAVRPVFTDCQFLFAGLSQFISPGAGIDWEPNATNSIDGGLMVGCLTAGNKGPGMAFGGAGPSTTQVHVAGCLSYFDNTLGVAGVGSTAVYVSVNSDITIAGLRVHGGYNNLSVAATGILRGSDLKMYSATQRAFVISGTAYVNNADVESSGGTGCYVVAGAVANFTNVRVVGAGQTAAAQAFDIYASGSKLTNCTARAHGPNVSYSYVVRTGANDCRLYFCPSEMAGTSGHYLDQTGTAVAFPLPQNARPQFSDLGGIASATQLGTGTPSSGTYLRGDGIWAAAFDREAALAATDVLTVKVTGDAQKRFEMKADGQMWWSDGTTDPSAGLINLYQAGSAILATDGHFRVGNRLYLGGASGISIFQGFGSPEGVYAAPIGTIYLQRDGAAGTSAWFKEADDNLNTGWQSRSKSFETIGVAVSDETTSITAGAAKTTFRMPFAMILTGVRASLATASTSGVVTVDINEGGASIMTTNKLSIDANEKTSTTAATAAVLTDTALADDAEITVDVDAAGTGAKGLKIWLIGRRV